MTLKAFAVGNSFLVKDSSGLMRLVTIDASRDLVRFFLPQFTTNNLFVYLLDSPVTLLTSVSDIIAVNARSGIGVREDIV